MFTSGQPRLLTFAEMLRDLCPLYRILLSTQHFLTVRQFLAREPRAAHGIATVAGEVALDWLCTCPWYCSYAPIPASQWLGIETWDPAQAQGVTSRPEQR